MAETILQTKLFIPPPRPSLVARPQLVGRLNGAANAKLILIAAPAGFGKTTLVTTWLAQAGRPAAWLSLDEHDNAPGRFFVYLLAAMQTVYPVLGQKLLAALNSSRPPADDALMPALINELAGHALPLTLVLDDYHEIQNETIHEALTLLVDYAPPGTQLVLTSREEPPLPLPRWRARGQLLEIGAVDLRFRGGEVPAFLRETMGLDLEETDVQVLAQRTEGWVAGLQLAALSLRSSGDSRTFIQDFGGSDRQIADYLLQEVLLRQPQEVQQFMLRTSILERLCAPLCDQTLEQKNSQSILERLDQANLFLIPLDNERFWYRYHHLLAQLLRQRLERQAAQAEIKDLRLRAAQWYVRRELRQEAVDQALQIPDYDYAAKVIASFPTHALFEQGGAGLVKSWAQALPEAIIQQNPRVGVLAVGAFMLSGETRPMRDYFALIEGDPAIQAEQDLFQSIMTRNQSADFEEGLHLAQRALHHLPGDEFNLRAIARLQIAVNQDNLGRLPAAQETLQDLRQELDQDNPATVSMLIQAIHMQASLAMEQADYYRAQQLCREGLAIAEERPDQRAWPFAALLLARLARIYYQWNDQEQTAAILESALDWGQRTGISDILIESHLVKADLAAWRGEGDLVEQTVSQLRGFTDDSWMAYIQEQVRVLVAYYHWRMGDLEQAVRWANASGLGLDDALTMQNYSKYLTLGRIRLEEARAAGQQQAARGVARLVGRMLQHLPQESYRFVNAQFVALNALAQDVLGDQEGAQAALAEALRLAQKGSLIRLFLDWGRPMEALLQSAEHLDPIYVGRLLAAFKEEPGFEPTARPAQQAGDALAGLTDREREVLALIAAGLSNKEIGERLFISNNTVRTHIKNLYSKIEVESRTQAVARGRELGLV